MRSEIFNRIRAATAALPAKAPQPEYDPALTRALPRLEGASLPEVFRRNLEAVNGKHMESAPELAAWLKENGHFRGYCDPALWDVVGAALAAAGLEVASEYDRERYDDYQFGVTRACGGIAETGTLILDDATTSHRLAALSPWVHVAVLDPANLLHTLADGLAALGDRPNVIWCTGPSKTADVEGILIEGVHGPGQQIALMV